MPKFQLSEKTASIVRFLQSSPKGTSVPYADITKAVGFKVGSRSPWLVYARVVLQRDHNAIWTCVRPGVGVKRLTDPEIAERLPNWWWSSARRKLSRGGDQADIVDIQQLDIDQQARFAVDSIQGELAREALSKATRRKMEKVARGTSNDLPVFSAIEWAISLSPKRKAAK